LTQRRLVTAAGLFVVGTAGVALVGWISGLLLLATLGEGRIPMAPSTVVLFLLYGTVLLLYGRAAPGPRTRRFALLSAAVGGPVSAALLWLSYSRTYLDVERLGFAAHAPIAGVPAGHMSPMTALGFLLTTFSLMALLASERERPRAAVAGFALASGLTAGASVLLLAYLYGVPLLYGGLFIPPATTTSLAFAALGIGLAVLNGARAWPRAGWLAGDAAVPAPGLLLLFVVVATGIVASGYLYVRAFETRYRAEVERSLLAIADLKVSELAQYRQERLADAQVFAGQGAFAALVDRFLRHPDDRAAGSELDEWLAPWQRHYQYDRLTLLDAAGDERLSVPAPAVPIGAPARRRALSALSARSVEIEDLHRNEHDGRVYLTIAVPIPTPDGDAPMAVLLLRIDPTTYLFPFIDRWPSSSQSATSYLVRREGDDVLVLSHFHGDENAPLNVRIPLTRTEVPAVQAALGREGIVEGTGIGGRPVISAIRTVPDSPWALITRIDVAEVYAPLRQQMWLTILLVGALVAAAGAALASVWRQRRGQLFRQRYEAERDRAWLREVIARSRNEVWVIDPETLRFTFASRGACANIGYREEDLVRMTLLDLAPQLGEPTLRALLDELRRGEREVAEIETVQRRRDGSEYPVAMRLQYVAAGDRRVFLVLGEDISERRRMEEELRQAQKMEAVGRLAGGIAHDFNNQIFVINGYCDLLLADARDQPAIAREVDEIKKAAARSAELTGQLLAFSRKQILAPKVLDANAELNGLEAMLRRLIGEDVRLTIRRAESLGRVKVDPGQFHQVILNLAINARDAMPGGGRLTIETANATLDEDYAGARLDVRPGPYVRLTVMDTGHGMTPEVKARIFEPFFSTKETGRGTGLGLSTAYGIVKQSGGHIDVASEPGRGTTFDVYLPRVEEPLTPEAPRLAPAEPQRGGGETVLLAEDEEALRLLLARALSERGYRVLAAAGGRDALAQADACEGPIHLLLTDVVMPEMSGPQLVERLQASHPEARVIFMSGYTDEAIVQHGVLRDGVTFLHKPCPTDLVLQRVREVLDAARRENQRGRRILIVDDSEADRVLQARMVARSGFEPLQAATGSEALALLEREEIDAVITDVNMPGMSGFDLTEAIRNSPRLRDLPVVILSGSVTHEEEVRGIAAAASAYLDKSTVDQPRLLEVLSALW